MDHDAFDRLARLLGSAGSRRGALGALLGAAFAGASGVVAARGNRRGRSRRRGLSAQAVNCANLASGRDVSGCDYAGEDHSGENLSSAKMIKTVFRDATLVGTNLHSANMKSATFRGADLIGANLASGVLEGASLRDANLCRADLRSAVVRHATFRDANLALANLKNAAGCGSATFTAGTNFCGTKMCDGSIRNDDCPGGPPPNLCCSDAECAVGESCFDNQCGVRICEDTAEITDCACLSRAGGDPVCVDISGICPGRGCSLNDPLSCPDGTFCTFSPCCDLPPGQGVCNPPCPFLDDCTCVTGPTDCGPNQFKKCGEVSTNSARAAAGSSQLPPAS
jgi:uncharacterized protein YjbI with pentapeptide repeats